MSCSSIFHQSRTPAKEEGSLSLSPQKSPLSWAWAHLPQEQRRVWSDSCSPQPKRTVAESDEAGSPWEQEALAQMREAGMGIGQDGRHSGIDWVVGNLCREKALPLS